MRTVMFGEVGSMSVGGMQVLGYGEGEFLHHNAEVEFRSTPLPDFDLHKVEEALLVNHQLFNGTPLTRMEVQGAIGQYREFLRTHKHRGMPTSFEVPSLVIDRVWHTHMCETRQYAEDCQSYFGTMFHHASSICNGGGVD